MRRGKQPLPDYYAILNVSSLSSADEIKGAYRRLVKEYHPDKFQSYADKNKNGEKVKEVIEAYQVLRKPQSRREYDQERVGFVVNPVKRVSSASHSSVSLKPLFGSGDWFLWVGGIATVVLTACIVASFLPKDPLDHPFLTAGKLLLLIPSMGIFAYMAVGMVMFFSMLVIEGMRYGFHVGAKDVERDHNGFLKKFLIRFLVVFFVSMAIVDGYFEWENQLLRVFAAIGVLIVGYGLIFVPVLFGEFFALLYYFIFTRRTFAHANTLMMQE